MRPARGRRTQWAVGGTAGRHSLLHHRRRLDAIFLWDRAAQPRPRAGSLEASRRKAHAAGDTPVLMVGGAGHSSPCAQRRGRDTEGRDLPQHGTVYLGAPQFLAVAPTGTLLAVLTP